MAQKRLSIFVKALITLALSTIRKHLLPRIAITEIRNGLDLLFDPLEETIHALSDADPNDTEQLKDIWRRFLESGHIYDYTEQELLQAAASIENEGTREIAMLMITPTISCLRILTDKDKNNGAQIGRIWEEFINKPEFRAFVLSLVTKLVTSRVESEPQRELIIETITLGFNMIPDINYIE